MRTLPYVRAWHQRYRDQGLQVIGVHSPGFPSSADPDNVAAAVQRLGIEYPVLIDSELQVFTEYDNLGWPARYLFNEDGRLFEYHFGEGAYDETELAIAECSGSKSSGHDPARRRDRRLLIAQSDDVPVPTAARTRPAALGSCSTATARSSPTAKPSRSTTPAPMS